MTVLPRAAYYERVSTDEQSEKDTIRSQDKALHRAYDRHFEPGADEPWTYVGTFKDDGVSGTIPFEQRLDGARLLQLIRRGEVDIVCVARSDRLARDRAIANNVADEFSGREILIQSPNEHIDLTTPAGRLHFAIMCDFSHYEREIIRDRTMAGRETHASNGEFINGPIPFGFDVKDCRLVKSTRLVEQLSTPEHPVTECDLVVDIFTRAADGESLLSIMRWLRATGVPSTKRYYNKKKERDHEQVWGMWQHSRLLDMINCTTYYGTRTLKYHTPGSTKYKKTPAYITQSVPALVTRELWDKARAAVKGHHSNFNTPRRTDDYVYLLSGKVVCGTCGFSMVGNFQKERRGHSARTYYACSRAKGRTNARRTGVVCTGPVYINGDKIEQLVLERLDEIVADPAAVLASIRAQQVEQHGDNTHEAQKKALRQRLANLERGRANMVKAMSDGEVSREEFRVQTADNAEQTAQVRRELDLIENEESITDALMNQLRDAEQMLGTLQAEWPTARTAERAALREFLKPLIQRIVVNRDKTVEGTILFDNRSTDSAKLCDYISIGRAGVALFGSLVAALR